MSVFGWSEEHKSFYLLLYPTAKWQDQHNCLIAFTLLNNFYLLNEQSESINSLKKQKIETCKKLESDIMFKQNSKLSVFLNNTSTVTQTFSVYD